MSRIKIDRDFKRNRSDRYQHLLVEAPCSPDMLSEYSDLRGLSGALNESSYCEEMYELQELLKSERWRLIKTKLTERQCEVIEHLATGATQIEVAKKLNVNQSSITKSLNGNCDYRNGKKIYGGAKRKLRKLASQDPEIQEIIEKMAECQETDW